MSVTIDVAQVFGRELNLRGAKVFLEPVTLGRSGNRHDPRLLRKEPGERDLRRRRRSRRAGR